MEHYPDYKTYQALYARYYKGRDVAELLQLLDPLKGARVLDLCGGDGSLALSALERGAGDCELIDTAPEMVPNAIRKDSRFRVHVGTVHDVLFYMYSRGDTFERVACRQAVNYWLNESTAGFVANVLSPGGVFAFNTFNQKPSEKPRVLEYEFEGHAFSEVSWLVGDTVHHLQVREGMTPHYTTFMWIAPERLQKMLEPYFSVVEERHEKTSLYRCMKK